MVDENQQSADTGERVFLVVVDDSQEMQKALRLAGLRARRTDGRVGLLRVVEPADFQHWATVGNLMREEARSEAERLLQQAAAVVAELHVALLHLDQEVVRALASAVDPVAGVGSDARPEVLVVGVLGAPARQAVGVPDEARPVGVGERRGLRTGGGLGAAADHEEVPWTLGGVVHQRSLRRFLQQHVGVGPTDAEAGPPGGARSVHVSTSSSFG